MRSEAFITHPVNCLELKPLTSQLLPAALELDRLCFDGLWTLDGYQRELDSPNSDLLGLSILPALSMGSQKSFDCNSPFPLFSSAPLPLIGLGCLWAILEEAHITILAIHPEYRHRGLGQALLIGLLKCAVQRHLEWATLEVRSSNQQALSLYQKFGFREVGRRRRYYQDTGEDALILWLNGLHQPEFTVTLANWHRQIHARLASAGCCINYQQSASNE